MTVEAVILTALSGDDAKRTGSLEDLAALVSDALADAGLLAQQAVPRCRSLYQTGTAVERFVRCTLGRAHDLPHSGQQNSTTTVTWLDEQAAGRLQERTA